jgi:hypothetical protein
MPSIRQEEAIRFFHGLGLDVWARSSWNGGCPWNGGLSLRLSPGLSLGTGDCH